MAIIPTQNKYPDRSGYLGLDTNSNKLIYISDGIQKNILPEDQIEFVKNVPLVKVTPIPSTYYQHMNLSSFALAKDFPNRWNSQFKKFRTDQLLIYDRYNVVLYNVSYNGIKLFNKDWDINIFDPNNLENFDPNNFYIDNVFPIKKENDRYDFLIFDKKTPEGSDISLYYVSHVISTGYTGFYEVGNIRKASYFRVHGIDFNPYTKTIIFAEYPPDGLYDTAKVYKINISNLNNIIFDTVFEQNTRTHPTDPQIRHFHTVYWYRYLDNDYWLLTSGDTELESKIWISTDDGLNWSILKENDKKFRLTDFTMKNNYLYWGEDNYSGKICKMSMEDFTVTDLITNFNIGNLSYYSITKTKDDNFLLIASNYSLAQSKIILFNEELPQIEVLKDLNFPLSSTKTKMLVDESIFSYCNISNSDFTSTTCKIELIY